MQFTIRPSSTGKDGYVEVSFPGKPGLAVREELKRSQFRWSRWNLCWYGPKAKLPAKYRTEQVQEPVSVPQSVPEPVAVAVEQPPVFDEPVPVKVEQPAPVPVGLIVRQTLGNNNVWSVVHAASNKAIGAMFQNLTNDEATRLMNLVLPLADWSQPVSELLKIPGLKDKLLQAIGTKEPEPVPVVKVLETAPLVPQPAPVQENMSRRFTFEGQCGVKGNTVPEPELVGAVAAATSEPKVDYAARLRAAIGR